MAHADDLAGATFGPMTWTWASDNGLRRTIPLAVWQTEERAKVEGWNLAHRRRLGSFQ